MRKVKITVLKTLSLDDLQEKYGHSKLKKTCPIHEEGEEFIVNEDLQMPDGFCSWAWGSIHADVKILGSEGNYRGLRWVKDENIGIVCCDDGLRPVIFKLEKTD